jgi:hypothetical protein
MATRPNLKLANASRRFALAGVAVLLSLLATLLVGFDNEGRSTNGGLRQEASRTFTPFVPTTTAPVLCRASIISFSEVGMSPIEMLSRPNGVVANYISTGQVVEILDMQAASDLDANATMLWYFGRSEVQGTQIQGWLPAEMIIPLTECPAPHASNEAATDATQVARAIQDACDDTTLPSRFTMGRDRGRVMNGSIEVNLYQVAGFDSPIIMTIAPNTEFILVSEVGHCQQGAFWYSISVNGELGWIPETSKRLLLDAPSTVYIIEPILTATPTRTPFPPGFVPTATPTQTPDVLYTPCWDYC